MPEKRLSELDGSIRSVAGRPQQDDCLLFDCPACNTGHMIMVSFMPPSLHLTGAIWKKVSGSTIEDITLNPSIDATPKRNLHPEMDEITWRRYVEQGCKFHGWVRNGTVSW
jgi:Family of unknown function (DUF6527)